MTLRELELTDELESPAVLRRAERIFPNIRKLNIGAQSPEVFLELWNCWPSLEVAGICLSYPGFFEHKPLTRSLDSVLGGFPEYNFPLVAQEMDWETGDYGNPDVVEGLRTLPSISNWKRKPVAYICTYRYIATYSLQVERYICSGPVTVSTSFRFG